MKIKILIAVMALVWVAANPLFGAESDEELAKKLANPVASLISLPLQYNYDKDFGPNEEGSKSVLNVQPVIPFSISQNWNLITRTIIPLIDQNDIPVNGQDESGLGDILQSFFFSPKEPMGGWIFGFGPALLYPTASDQVLGGEKWGAGPTVVALTQANGWTYGFLVNHIESFAGDDDRATISATFLQPFLSYITKTKTTFGINTETTYDWRSDVWAVPINFSISQLLRIGMQPLQISLGGRYWAASPDFGPEGFGLRATLTFLFPK